MDIKKFILGILILIVISLPVVSIVIWYISPTYPINIMIVDKTVVSPEANEHKSFNWVLKHHKYVKPDYSYYELDDYLGFFPLDSEKFYINDLDLFKDEQLDSIADTLDMIYFTDTYGVYYNEWYRHKNLTEHSEIIYGRTSKNDYQLMEKMHERQKLVLTEFNTIASPTNVGVRKKVENEFGVKWSGWVGRYMYSLDTTKNLELPHWVVKLYKEQYNNTWPFKESGIIFVHESERIVIIEKGVDLDHEVPIINTDKYYQEFFDLPEYMRYPFWFDISFIEYDDMVISYYKIHANDRGDSILECNNIPSEFPAVLVDHIINRFFYFAGDFADNPIPFTAVYSRGIENTDFFFYDNKDYSDRKKFFWRYYRPLIQKIMSDYYAVLEYERKANFETSPQFQPETKPDPEPL